VHPADRVIVLDAGHLLSADLLPTLLATDRPQPAVGSAAAAAVRAAAAQAGSSSSIPVEGVAALLGLQMMSFLCAVCNVVSDRAAGMGLSHNVVCHCVITSWSIGRQECVAGQSGQQFACLFLCRIEGCLLYDHLAAAAAAPMAAAPMAAALMAAAPMAAAPMAAAPMAAAMTCSELPSCSCC